MHGHGDGRGTCSGLTRRFMGSYKWSYKSPNMGYKYSCPTYNPTQNKPMNLQVNPLAASRNRVVYKGS